MMRRGWHQHAYIPRECRYILGTHWVQPDEVAASRATLRRQDAPLSIAMLTLLMYSEQPSSHEMPKLYVALLGTVMKPAEC